MSQSSSANQPLKKMANAESIIRALSVALDGLTLQDLEAATNQSKSAIHRVLGVLSINRWVEVRKLNDRSFVWLVSAEFIRMAYLWKQCTSSEQINMGDHRMLTTECPTNNDVVSKSIRIFHLVVNGGIKGLTLDELYMQAGYPRTTTHRILCSWGQLGWLSAIKISGRAEKWCPSSKLIEVAHEYENQCHQQLHNIREAYEEMTGEAL